MAKSSSIPSHSSPSNLGYRMPAEWERHQGTWLTWPPDATSSSSSIPSGQGLAQQVFTRMVRSLAMVETVHVNVRDAGGERAVLKSLGSAPPNLVFHHFATNNIFCRDYGAIFICRRDAAWRTPPLVAIDWGYAPSNAELGDDDNRAIPMSMARALELPCISGCLNLHGGDIDTNGQGLLLTTEGCLPVRNSEFQKQQIEQRVAAMLGVSKILWLTDIANDVSRRVDDVARFVNADTVVASVAKNPLDPSHDALQENLRRLATVRLDGKPLNVVPLPLPESGRAASRASYTGFYICNELVFLPQFQQPTDIEAQERLASLFPGRHIVGIECDLNEGCGAVHGRTQQVPPLELAGKKSDSQPIGS